MDEPHEVRYTIDMIMHIIGTVIFKEGNVLLVETHGIGYKIRATRETVSKVAKDKEIKLWTHLAVREDAFELYGFVEKKELDLFEKLISVSGIGPKSALAILNLAPVSKLNQAISSGDTAYLTKVSGIGKKSAAKIILELKDTITEEGYALDEGELREEKDALLALVSLGYGMTEARDALRKVKTKSGTTGETIKAALKLLGQQ